MPSTAVAPATAGVKVGDFFVRSWGYDQTNIDFYKVVGLTPKGVKVQHWTEKCVDDPNQPITHVVPGDNPKQGCWVKSEGGGSTYDREAQAPVETKRLSSYDEGNSCYIAVGSYNDSARRWDGRPCYQTGFGYGH